MLQLTPGEQFPIVRQLNDPSDTATYFVQAVIKRSVDEIILATVNLTDQGGQRFKTNWQVVSDNGLGVFITITSTVYTDSGYTTKSDIYGIQSTEYLIQERLNRSLMNTFGGGSGVNYDTIRKIIRQEVEKMVFPEIKIPKTDLSVVLVELKDIRRKVAGKEAEFSVVTENIKEMMTGIKNVYKAVGSLPIPEKADFSQVIEAIKSVNDSQLKKEGLDEFIAKGEEVLRKLYNVKFNINLLKDENGKVEIPKFRLPRKVYKQ